MCVCVFVCVCVCVCVCLNGRKSLNPFISLTTCFSCIFFYYNDQEVKESNPTSQYQNTEGRKHTQDAYSVLPGGGFFFSIH